MTDNKGLLITIALLTSVCLILNLVAMSKIGNIEVDAPDITIDTAALATAIASQIVIPEPIVGDSTDTSTDKVDYIYNKLHEEDAVEDKALELTDEYILSRDFKKLLEDGIFTDGDNNSIVIEDYKDIESIKIVDSDFYKSNDTVKYDLKVYYLIDGDEDDKVRITIEGLVIPITDLEYDDDFEDAEVDEEGVLLGTVSKVKFY